MNMNMGNLNLDLNNLKNRLATEEKEKAVPQMELDEERDFQEYKHNIEIWMMRNKAKNEQKIKMPIQKLQDENKELKVSTTWMKSQHEKLQELKQKDEIQETITRKWAKALLFYK